MPTMSSTGPSAPSRGRYSPGLERRRAADSVDDDLIAVLAHGWLNSTSVIHLAAQTLLEEGDRVSDELHRELLTMIATQAVFLGDSLTDMVRGARPEVLSALDEFTGAVRQPV
jgi:hypothetical protein